jgi:hypothetical protein
MVAIALGSQRHVDELTAHYLGELMEPVLKSLADTDLRVRCCPNSHTALSGAHIFVFVRVQVLWVRGAVFDREGIAASAAQAYPRWFRFLFAACRLLALGCCRTSTESLKGFTA